MYAFIVHVLREGIDGWSFRAPGVERIRGYNGTQTRDVKTSIHEINEGTESLLETWYCNTRTEADALATLFAQQKPGQTVYVAETRAYHLAPPGKVKISLVTEKGVVPQ